MAGNCEADLYKAREQQEASFAIRFLPLPPCGWMSNQPLFNNRNIIHNFANLFDGAGDFSRARLEVVIRHFTA